MAGFFSGKIWVKDLVQVVLFYPIATIFYLHLDILSIAERNDVVLLQKNIFGRNMEKIMAAVQLP